MIKNMEESVILKELQEIKRLTLLSAKNVFTVKDLALYLGKSEKTIRNTLDKYPHYYNELGQATFLRSDIEAWQTRVKHTPTNTIL